MNKINICTFGHNNDLAVKEFSDYLTTIFKKFNFSISKIKNIENNAVNILFEGHHPNYRIQLLDLLKKNKNYNKGIAITEVIYGISILPMTLYTFNNKFLNSHKGNTLLTLTYLIVLNFFFYFTNFFFKKFFWNLFQRVKQQKNSFFSFIIYKFLFFFLNSYDHPNGNFYWKERYNYFIKIVNEFDFVINISSYHEDFFVKKFKKYFLVEFLSTGKKIKYSNNIAKIDCLFTGQLTDYRLEVFKQLEENKISYKFYDYLDETERLEKHEQTKIYLALKKFKEDNLPIGTRAWYCLENSLFFVCEKTFVKNSLSKYVIMINSDKIIQDLEYHLSNYQEFKENFYNLLKEYNNNPFFKDKEILKLINFLRLNL